MMAAAAAATAAALNRQQQEQQAASGGEAPPTGSGAAAAAARAAPSVADPSGLVSSIKRRLARLIPSAGSGVTQPDDSQPLARSRQSPVGPEQAHQSAAEVQTSPQSAQHPAVAALLQQYQFLPPHHAALLMPAPPLPPPPAALSHLFGLHHHHHLHHEPLFRPPPPSYNAAMQDQRLRMLLQERAALQQHQHRLTPLPVSAATPPPAGAAAGAASDRSTTTQSGQLNEGPSTNVATQTNTCCQAAPADGCQAQVGGSAPEVAPVVTTNDIYERCPASSEASAAADAPSSPASATVVSIGPTETVVCRPPSGPGPAAKPEVEVLGYL